MATIKKPAKKAAPKKVVKKTAPKKTEPQIILKKYYDEVAGWRPHRIGRRITFGCGAVTVTLNDARDFFNNRPAVLAVDSKIAALQAEKDKLLVRSGYSRVFSQLQQRGSGTVRQVDDNLTAIRKNLLGY